MRIRYLRSLIYLVIGVALVLAAGSLDPNNISHAQAAGTQGYVEPYQNQYVPSDGPGTVGAQLYPCPRWVPPVVGHTYITYEPLAPHEFLYRHGRVYRTDHIGAPPTRTRVHWR